MSTLVSTVNEFSSSSSLKLSRYLVLVLFLFCQVSLAASNSSQWIDYPTSGGATMTHYGLPLDDIAACGCTAESTHYPTAALSQMAYGSSRAYGECAISPDQRWIIYHNSAQLEANDGYLLTCSMIAGPGCGKCFKLTLLNTFESDPPFYPSVTKSVVIKVTDLCPLSEDGWCSGTNDKTNAWGLQSYWLCGWLWH